MKKIFFVFAALMALVGSVSAQNPMMKAPNPATWTASVQLNEDGNSGVLTLTADIAEGWHVYGFDIPEGGPNSTVVDFNGTSECVVFDSELTPVTEPIKKYDDVFEMEVSWWENKAVFTRNFKLNCGEKAAAQCDKAEAKCEKAATECEKAATCCQAHAHTCCAKEAPKCAAADDCKVVVNVNFMACNDASCMPPRTDTLTVKIEK